jgi:urease accessory protein
MTASVAVSAPPLVAPDGLLRLLSWLSPAFPVGGFSYSHGLETAFDKGLIADAATTQRWIASILGHGAGWTDALLFLAAHRAVAGVAGAADLPAVVALASALRATAETAIESRAQGQAFVATLRAAWPDPAFEAWVADLGPSPAYAVAVAVATGSAGIDEETALSAFLHALAAGLVSAAVRLVPLGQTDGQRAVAGLAAGLPALVARARRTSLDDLGSSTPMVEWTSAQHETQYTRLFRS